eukprot:TRINITY_DN26717_c0_g1_i1.p3 TRINITY_DN26717_c0_g1~~TRINITY_DN26717_c0_g1_i1.p3  ORF type:complete len:109 (+),score=2.68 TRINITY_DN26717_c0_g1_i1:6-332(+)
MRMWQRHIGLPNCVVLLLVLPRDEWLRASLRLRPLYKNVFYLQVRQLCVQCTHTHDEVEEDRRGRPPETSCGVSPWHDATCAAQTSGHICVLPTCNEKNEFLRNRRGA